MAEDERDPFLEKMAAERSLSNLLSDLGFKKVRFPGLDEGYSIKGTDADFSTVIASAPERVLYLSVDPDGVTVYARRRGEDSTNTPVEYTLRDDQKNQKYTIRVVGERGGMIIVAVNPSNDPKKIDTYTIEAFRRLKPRRVRE